MNLSNEIIISGMKDRVDKEKRIVCKKRQNESKSAKI